MSQCARPTVSFVVPLYFTGPGVPGLLDAFRDLPIPGGYELILVNDGSTDGTFERALKGMETLAVPVTLIDLARNFGEHAAVMAGLRQARGRYVINLDDDLQNPIGEALKVLDHLIVSDADVVYTWFDDKKHSGFRNFGSWLTNCLATFLLEKPRDLYLSSFRGMRREVVEWVTRYSGPYPYVDGLILGATDRIQRIRVAHDRRKTGRSGYTLRRLLRLWANMFFNFSVMPLRAASVLGVVLCFLGGTMLAVVFVDYFINGVKQAGWGSLMAAISIFSGSQLLILGVLGEYVGRTYLTLSGKPQSIVRSIHRNEK